MSNFARKHVFFVFLDEVQHTPGCIATEVGLRFEISHLETTGIALCSENKGVAQLHGFNLISICKKISSCHGSNCRKGDEYFYL